MKLGTDRKNLYEVVEKTGGGRVKPYTVAGGRKRDLNIGEEYYRHRFVTFRNYNEIPF